MSLRDSVQAAMNRYGTLEHCLIDCVEQDSPITRALSFELPQTFTRSFELPLLRPVLLLLLISKTGSI